MRGRKPDPLELQVLHNVRPSRLRTGQPIPLVAEPQPPRGAEPQVKRVFLEIVGELRALRMASTADALVIEVLAVATIRQRQAAAVIAREGFSVPTSRGGLTAHPALRLERDAQATILRAASELGLSPTGRTRVRVGEQPSSARDREIEQLLS